MDDSWEIIHGLIVGLDDSGLDLDFDGRSNLDEFREGTLPGDSRSYLHLSVEPTATGLNLGFTATPDTAYTIEYTDSLTSPINWIELQQIGAESEQREIQLPIEATEYRRFFRIVVSSP